MFMKIYVICDSDEKKCLETVANFFESKEIELVTEFNQIESHNDRVVVSHSIIPILPIYIYITLGMLYRQKTKRAFWICLKTQLNTKIGKRPKE